MRLSVLVLVAVSGLVLFVGLDTIGLVDVREARDAQVVRELTSAKEILTPTLAREPLFEKPVLAYAPEFAMRFLSDTPDLSSRQLRAVGALALILLTVLLGAVYFGPRAGVWAGVVLATSFAVPLAARTDGTQLLASMLGWLGCAGIADALFGRRAGRGFRLVVAYVALAAAAVCVGPWPALWPILGTCIYLLLRRAGGWRRLHLVACLALIAGICLPWYGAMFERHGMEFLSQAPFFPYAAESRSAWYLGIVMMPSFLVIGFFPWSTLLPGAILHASMKWRQSRRRIAVANRQSDDRPRTDPVGRERREETLAHFFVACLLAALVPIVFYVRGPLPSVLPALPAAALLCGRLIDHVFEDASRVVSELWRATFMLALVGTVLAVLITLMGGRIREAADAFRLLGPVILVTAWAPFLANLLRRRALAAGLIALPIALGTPIVALKLLPQMEDYLNTRVVAEAMASVSPPRAPLVLIEPAPPSLRYYSQRNLIAVAEPAEALERFRASDGLAYLAFRPRHERHVAAHSGGTLEIVARTPSMVLARLHPN